MSEERATKVVVVLFLPAVGYRNNSLGAVLTGQGTLGPYWSSSQASSTVGSGWYVTISGSTPISSPTKDHAFTIRCVR